MNRALRAMSVIAAPVALALFLLAGPVHAATYVVDQAHPQAASQIAGLLCKLATPGVKKW